VVGALQQRQPSGNERADAGGIVEVVNVGPGQLPVVAAHEEVQPAGIVLRELAHRGGLVHRCVQVQVQVQVPGGERLGLLPPGASRRHLGRIHRPPVQVQMDALPCKRTDSRGRQPRVCVKAVVAKSAP
jgi:hypothetical protein